MMSDAPIKTCDYCDTVGQMPTFRNGETICKPCLVRLPIEGAEARKQIVSLEKQLKASTGNSDWQSLYVAVNEMMAVIGAHGQIVSKDDRVIAVMDALHDLDGGVFDVNRISNSELLEPDFWHVEFAHGEIEVWKKLTDIPLSYQHLSHANIYPVYVDPPLVNKEDE